MQNAPTSPKAYTGATCNLSCARCSTRNNRSMRQPHAYVVDRSRRPALRFWECTVCGHQTPVLEPANVAEKGDPEVETLHAQWREDNKNYPRWTRDHRR
jgi:hypothetical protein